MMKSTVQSSDPLLQKLKATTSEHLGKVGQVVLAPGRVNLIGEHTDYNDGFVLPMAIDRYVGVAFVPRSDRCLQAHAPDYGGERLIALDRLEEETYDGWAGYVAGVAWAMQEEGLEVPGANLVIQGDVPIGAGLSSSAALEMAVARALCTMAGLDWQPVAMAQLGRKAENEYVGVSCGIMDQFASAASAEGYALLLDCRSLDAQRVPLPPEAAVVVMDTGVRRSLADSAFNERHEQCRQAVAVLREYDADVQALRDVSPPMLERHREDMDAVTYKRACHVMHENTRPVRMAEALRNEDLARAGQLMNDSHKSLRDLYEVSSPELDGIVEAALHHPACYGARLTGAGMGGCGVALIRRDQHEDFIESAHAAYRQRFEHDSAFYLCEPSAGAHVAA